MGDVCIYLHDLYVWCISNILSVFKRQRDREQDDQNHIRSPKILLRLSEAREKKDKSMEAWHWIIASHESDHD